MEYMPMGSLYKILHDQTIKLSLDIIRKMMVDAAKGMNYLHKSVPVIIHRDLKSHNVHKYKKKKPLKFYFVSHFYFKLFSFL